MSKYPIERNGLGAWLNERGLLGAGVEVGCANGQFTAIVAEVWDGRELAMVDPWKKQDSSVYREITNEITDFDSWKSQCLELAKKDRRIRLIQKLSVDGADHFAPQSLDWVYLDGNHSYLDFSQDLNCWWPKIRPGGILGGHDCLNKLDEGWHCEVKSALDDWCDSLGLEYHVTPCTSFWIIKPVLVK